MGEAQTPHFHDFWISERVPNSQNHLFSSLETPGHLKQIKKHPKSLFGNLVKISKKSESRTLTISEKSGAGKLWRTSWSSWNSWIWNQYLRKTGNGKWQKKRNECIFPYRPHGNKNRAKTVWDLIANLENYLASLDVIQQENLRILKRICYNQRTCE